MSGRRDIRLLADVGGTNVRFALAEAGSPPRAAAYYDSATWPDLASAAAAFISGLPADQRPLVGGFAVAAPITGDEVRFTNRSWSFSVSGLRRALGLDRLEVLNDLAAAALAVPGLAPDQRRQLGGGAPEPGQPLAVIGPGTGLGIAGLVPCGDAWLPLSGEGGHASFAPEDEREIAILQVLKRRFGRVSNERLLSGPGLVNVYLALVQIEGRAPPPAVPTPVEVVTLAGEGDTAAADTLDCFAAVLGGVAGDLALTLGSRGGVYIAGGLCLHLGDRFAVERFRQRFEAKGRFDGYVAGIPTYLLLSSEPALLGLARWLDRSDG